MPSAMEAARKDPRLAHLLGGDPPPVPAERPVTCDRCGGRRNTFNGLCARCDARPVKYPVRAQVPPPPSRYRPGVAGRVLAAIHELQGREVPVYPSIERLAEMVGVSARQAHYARQYLIARGRVTITAHMPGRAADARFVSTGSR